LRAKLIKIGAKVVSHGRYVMFQMAEVALPRQMFHDYPAADRATRKNSMTCGSTKSLRKRVSARTRPSEHERDGSVGLKSL
jgi:hypothetical protein